MGAVDQAVGEVLAYYLEEHPKAAKTIVDKVILAATARHAARTAVSYTHLAYKSLGFHWGTE